MTTERLRYFSLITTLCILDSEMIVVLMRHVGGSAESSVNNLTESSSHCVVRDCAGQEECKSLDRGFIVLDITED